MTLMRSVAAVAGEFENRVMGPAATGDNVLIFDQNKRLPEILQSIRSALEPFS